MEPWQIGLGIVGALLIGFSKTGLPGTGILMVPLMASIFGGRLSVGATLPMLIFADCFAVRFYHAHADFDRLRKLFGWVSLGLLGGVAFLKVAGDAHTSGSSLNAFIGWIVLLMIVLGVVRNRLGERFAPHGRAGTALVGAGAGFTTMASNAAGPLMAIYFTSMRLDKLRFMGTGAWFFLLVNVAKLPFVIWLTWLNPSEPLMSVATLQFNALMIPFLVMGAFLGRWLLQRIHQAAFEWTVLAFAAVAAIRLIIAS